MNSVKVIIRKVDRDFIDKNYDFLVASLYPERRCAIKKLKNKSAIYTSITAGRLLQDVVARELGLLPEEIEIGRGKQGKPFLINYEQFKYNISHSGNYVVLAYGEKELGVDIEQVRSIEEDSSVDAIEAYEKRTKRDLKVSERYFCDIETEYIMNNKPTWFKKTDGRYYDNVNINFTLTWTMKESLVKLMGCGITVPLNSFQIDHANKKIIDNNKYFEYWQQGDMIICLCTEEIIKIEKHYEERWVTCILKDD